MNTHTTIFLFHDEDILLMKIVISEVGPLRSFLSISMKDPPRAKAVMMKIVISEVGPLRSFLSISMKDPPRAKPVMIVSEWIE